MAKQSSRTSGIESGRKLLSLLLAFTEDRPLWTAAELEEELQVTQSTAYRYIGLLKDMGLLEGTTAGRHRVTERVLGLAEACYATRPALQRVALPVMRRLVDEVNETVILARRTGDFAYCVERIEADRAVRLQFNLGQPMALHSGSIPRILLAATPPRARTAYVERILPIIPADRRELLTAAALDAALEAGYVESHEEIDEGIWGTAALIKERRGGPAAIGTAGPVFRLPKDRRTAIIHSIREAAHEISETLESPASRDA